MGTLISLFPGSTHFGVGDSLCFYANPLIRQINVSTPDGFMHLVVVVICNHCLNHTVLLLRKAPSKSRSTIYWPGDI